MRHSIAPLSDAASGEFWCPGRSAESESEPETSNVEHMSVLRSAAEDLVRMIKSAEHIVDAAQAAAFEGTTMRLPDEPPVGEIVHSVDGEPTYWWHAEARGVMPSGWYEVRTAPTRVGEHRRWKAVRDTRVWAPMTWACLLRALPAGVLLVGDDSGYGDVEW